MSNFVLPTPPGLAWNSVRRPTWSTVKKKSVSGRSYTNALYSYPIWTYKLTYEFLRSDATRVEMQTLAAFFNSVLGSYDTWLFNDPDDNAVTAQGFGVGDGVTVAFQLVRAFGGYSEPVFANNGAPSIYKDGVLQVSGYTVSNGLVTFSAAPANGVVLTWTGAFYWRCKFTNDQLDFNQFMRRFWELKQLEFETYKP